MWAPILAFPGYSVSNLGQIRNDRFDRIHNVNLNQYGVPFTSLMRDGTQHQRSVARLVAKAFVAYPEGYDPEIFDTPIHLDGNRLNCAADNLMWRPRWFAVRYHRQFKPEWAYDYTRAPVRAIETGEEFEGTMAAACRYGVLEYAVVNSIYNGGPVWPVRLNFEFV